VRPRTSRTLTYRVCGQFPPKVPAPTHLNSMDYTQLRLVDEALDRLNSGDYGVCLACEEPIPAKRLRALPWARFCVPCQETAGAALDREVTEARGRTPVGLRD